MRLTKEDKELIEEAKNAIKKSMPVNLENTSNVGAALITSKGNIYRGVRLGFFCLDSCGEYQAIGAMISNGEKEIKKIVAVRYDLERNRYIVVPPCGICREMIHQLGKKNWNVEVIISEKKKVKLKDLLPYPWHGTIDNETKKK